MKKELKERLPQLGLGTLHQLDRGGLAKRFSDAIGMCLTNIAQYPCRDGKAETRAVHLSVYLTPELKMKKRGVETAGGRQVEVDVPEICGLIVRAKVKSAIPDSETADVRMVVDLMNGRITDARFNPENNDNPDQLELFDEDEVLAEAGE